jgi:putative FmdB family regulatory protein
MAIYEYTCGVCDKSVTITRSITDPDGSYACDACDLPLKRVYALPGVAFRGSGFYSTDK